MMGDKVTLLRLLLEAPQKDGPAGDKNEGFYGVGNKVCYKSRYFLFGGDPGSAAPEQTLLVARTVEGNYGVVISAQDVADLVAKILNEARSQPQ